MFEKISDLLLNANTSCQVIPRAAQNARIDPQANIVIARPDQAAALALPAFRSVGELPDSDVTITRIVTIKNAGTAPVTVSADGATIEGQRSTTIQPGEAQSLVAIPNTSGATVVEYALIATHP